MQSPESSSYVCVLLHITLPPQIHEKCCAVIHHFCNLVSFSHWPTAPPRDNHLVRPIRAAATLGAGTSPHVLPRSLEASARARQKTLFFIRFRLLVNLCKVELGRTEQGREEHNEEYAEESELCPEIDSTEDRPVQCDSVEKSRHDRGRANGSGGSVVLKLRARLDESLVVRAIGLVARVTRWIVAIDLGTKGSILRRDHGKDGVVDGEDDQGQHHSSDQQGLRKSSTFLNLEDANPQESDANSSNTADGAAEEEQDEESHEDIINRERFGRLNKEPVDRLEDVDVT